MEDRLIDQAKQKEAYLKKLKDFYDNKELQDIRDRPMINPKSAEIAKKLNEEEIYEKGVHFMQQKEHAR